ncbi:MAG: thiamine pyrophosphate-dependent enzyme [Desulfobacterales bacterium]|nr:thiamine pyrophosphate-dependent enzyme [Desulfobacterales bacterium]
MSMLSMDQPGKELMLMGNDAIARGAIEAGVKVCAAYPGNPSSEIIGNLSKVGKELNIHVEWSTNEKVAMEVAAGASLGGVRALAAMKHNGLNVACDFLFNLNLTGTKAGMVIIICDDPEALSSSNEQDCRTYAKMLDLPLFEPGTFQEGKDMVIKAFEVSEQLGLPVFVRSVTRFSHARGNVILGRLPTVKPEPGFDPSKPLYPKPVSRTRKALKDKLRAIMPELQVLPFNRYVGPDAPKLLIFTSGTGFVYSREAIAQLGVKDRVGVAKVGTSWPLPESFVLEQMKQAESILFVEESDPVLEDAVTALFGRENTRMEPRSFFGKRNGIMREFGELNPNLVMDGICRCLGMESKSRNHLEYAATANDIIPEMTPERDLGLCAGCPHRATYWAVKNALAMDGRKGFVVGDIGCYAQGRGPSGFHQMKTMHAMGSGAGLSNGFGQLVRFGFDQPVITVCGDSTFFHAAVAPLINAQYNHANFLFLVLDNSATAMTGFQPHPGTGKTATGDKTGRVDVEAVCRAIGSDSVYTQNPFDLEASTQLIYDLIQKPDGVKVVIMRQPCALVRVKFQPRLFDIRIDTEKCLGENCGCNRYCTKIFKCPGLYWDAEAGHTRIDEAICNGCGVCASICPSNAIIKEKIKS